MSGVVDNGTIRVFESGATRDTADDKLDFDGFLSPLVIQRYAEYMHRHRRQSDGTLRAADNWKKGFGLSVYMKSMWRHFFAVWSGYHARRDIREDLCALLFNVMGMLHELLKVEAGLRPIADQLVKFAEQRDEELSAQANDPDHAGVLASRASDGSANEDES